MGKSIRATPMATKKAHITSAAGGKSGISPAFARAKRNKHPPALKCTPKVRQTLGGAFYYAKEETQHKILAGIQDICYNGYARKPFWYNGNREKIRC